jgi:integrase
MLSYETIRNFFRKIGYRERFTAHGIRGTFSTYWNEIGADMETIELCLAHAERNAVRRAYNHAQKLEQRRKLLQEWADLSDAWRMGAKVIPIGARA